MTDGSDEEAMHNAVPQSVGINTKDSRSIYSTNAMTTMMSMAGGRRRSQRACEMCYRKKTKCEIEGPGLICVQCARRNTQCVFPGHRETTPDVQSEEYVKSLQDRLGRIESLLKAAGILNEGDLHDGFSDDEDELPDGDWNGHQRTGSFVHSPAGSCAFQTSPDRETALFPGGGDLEAAPLFRQHEQDDSRYFGRSCSLSILSRGGIEWIKSKTGDVSFLNIISPDSEHDSPWSSWRPDVFHDLFASQVFRPLPPRSEVFSSIEDFFRTANRIFPIFHKGSFMKMVEWQYTQQTCDDAARWASINMTICLAYEFRVSNSLKPQKDREKAREYFKNAMSVFTELALRRTDLLSVQALLSMAFFLRGNSGTQSALPFITAAMRSCQRMGLHRNIPRPDLSLAEQEQRRRVFWVAFTIDQSTCLRAGNGPSQHPDDFDVPPPEEVEDDNDSGSSSNIPFFRQICRMALIKSRIYCRLYAAKALLKPPREIFQTVKELHAELEAWKKDYPFDVEPRLKIAEPEFLSGFASIGLHFVYYNALIMIHRIPLLLNYLIASRDESEDLKSLSKAHAAKSGVICVQAARDTLRMVKKMPWGDIAWIWSLLYYVFLATATMFSNIIREPRHPQVREDLDSLNMASTFFASLVPENGPDNYAECMARMSANLEGIARRVVNKDEKRPLDLEEADQEQQSGAKRHNHSTVSKAHSKTRHDHSALRTSTTSNAPGSRNHTLSSISPSNPSSTDRPSHSDFSIPSDLEGFPSVNSSGYVVPTSPTSTDYPTLTNHQNSTVPPPLHTTSLSQGLDNTTPQPEPHHTNTSNFSPNPSFSQQPQDHRSIQPSSPLENTRLHTPSQNSSTGTNPNPIPSSWQVPLTADWEFGDNPWAGLFPSEAIAASAHAPQMSFPILSAESFLTVPQETEYGGSNAGPGLAFGSDTTMPYNNFSAAGVTQDSPAQGEGDQLYWPNGFLGLF